jgi:histidyl-tRNA synthetase
MKSQMKKADASGAAYAVIVGEAEMASGAVAVKALRDGAADRAFAQQTTVALERLADAVIDALQTASGDVQHDGAAIGAVL